MRTVPKPKSLTDDEAGDDADAMAWKRSVHHFRGAFTADATTINPYAGAAAARIFIGWVRRVGDRVTG